MTDITRWPYLTIPEDDWEEDGDDSDPRARLIFAFYLNGSAMHLHAICVRGDNEAINAAWEGDLDKIYRLGDPDKPYQKQTIRGRQYVVYAYPFC